MTIDGASVRAVPNPAEMASVQEYVQGVMPLFARAGGQMLKRLETDQIIQGRPSGMTLVMDFDSAATVTALFASDDYAALVHDRSYVGALVEASSVHCVDEQVEGVVHAEGLGVFEQLHIIEMVE